MTKFSCSRFLRHARELIARGKVRFAPNSRLGLKFLTIISVILLLGALLSSALILFSQHQQLDERARDYTEHVGDVVQASLEHAMLSSDKPMLDQMLRAIARSSGLERASILDTEGRVWLSSTPADEGYRFRQSEPVCRICHVAGVSAHPSVPVPTTRVSGETVFTVAELSNRPACYTCHGSSAQSLGLLLIETPLANFQNRWISSFWQIVISTSIMFLLLAGLLTCALGRLVVQPVVQLARDAREIGAGNLDFPSRVTTNDEVGELADAFDTMRQQLRAALAEKERRNRELQMLNEIARATSRLLDPQQILDLTVHTAISSLGVQAGAIYLLDPECGQFTSHACQGMPECRERACHLWRFNQVLAGLKRPDCQAVSVLIADLTSSPPLSPPAPRGTGEEDGELSQDGQGRSFVGVPLRAQGVLLGGMTLVTHPGQTVTEDGTKTLQAIGEHIGLALANAVHFQNARNEATLEERERLAREMHDSLAQALGYLKLQASLTDDLLSKGQIVQARANLREVKEIAKETYVDVREAIFGLRYEASPGPEFLIALEEYLSEYCTHYGLQVQLLMNPECRPSFSHQVSIQLTRIIQEALTNVRKHARTNQARLSIEQVDHHWQVTVEDDGQGFDPQAVPPGGQRFLGLHIMRERAESIGAQLGLNSRPGGGTSVVVRIPITSEHQDAAASIFTSPHSAGR